jgi:hypothetical protein
MRHGPELPDGSNSGDDVERVAPDAILLRGDHFDHVVPDVVTNRAQQSAARRVWNFGRKAVSLLQALDEKVIDRHPNRPAPVGVAAEQARVRLTG